jgi:hypothetical protein
MGRGALATGLAAALVAGAACWPGRSGGLFGPTRDAGGQAGQTLRYQSATYQLARGGRIHVVLLRRLGGEVAPGDSPRSAEASAGPDADDFEYVFFDLPERSHYGWVRQDDLPAWRWVRLAGRDRVWHAVAGHVALRFAPDKATAQAQLDVTLEPRVPRGGAPDTLNGRVALREDVLRTQGLVNEYGGRLATLLAAEPGHPHTSD